MQRDEEPKVWQQVLDEEEPPHIDDEENLLWAVSYSDLLMVLMSFFVIFFSAEEQVGQGSVFEQILMSMRGEDEQGQQGADGKGSGKGDAQGEGSGALGGLGGKKLGEMSGEEVQSLLDAATVTYDGSLGMGESGGAGIGGDTGGEKPGTEGQGSGARGVGIGGANEGSGLPLAATRLPQQLAQVGLDTELEATENSMAVHFPDDIFPSRQFNVTPDLDTMLKKFYVAMIPYMPTVDLIFVGHSDSRPVSRGGRFLRNNFFLSSLRASSALEHAIGAGLPRTRLFAQGGAENERDSRSLSVRIRVREPKK